MIGHEDHSGAWAPAKKGRLRLYKLGLIVALCAGLSGCALYRDVPLPTEPILSTPEGPQTLALFEVAERALASSPNLMAQRHAARAVMAEARASGLLPDPQFSASGDHPTIRSAGLVDAYALGLSQDSQALLTEPSRWSGARAKVRQSKLDLLWAEWQTVQSAGTLYIQKLYADKKAGLLEDTSKVLALHAQRTQAALAAHNTTIDLAGPDLSAALDIATQRDAADRAALLADSDLKVLLAYAPSSQLDLSEPKEPDAISEHDLKAALKSVAKRRPDLLALQAGYHAQSEAVRTAILEQFPTVNVGFNRAADTSNVQTNGLSVTLNIPVFGSTQAHIRAERATRAQLNAEYLARLDQTEADAWRIWRQLNLARSQLAEFEKSVPQLEEMADRGRKAYMAGNLAPATYVLLQTSLATSASELFDLKTALWNDTIALRTLLALTPLFPGAATPGLHQETKSGSAVPPPDRVVAVPDQSPRASQARPAAVEQ